MYIEAEDKITLEKKREITFVQVSKVLGIIYHSKSGKTKLKWRSSGNGFGIVTGNASIQSLVNLVVSKIIDESYTSHIETKRKDYSDSD